MDPWSAIRGWGRNPILADLAGAVQLRDLAPGAVAAGLANR